MAFVFLFRRVPGCSRESRPRARGPFRLRATPASELHFFAPWYML